MRVTMKMLNHAVTLLNSITGNPQEPYRSSGGKHTVRTYNGLSVPESTTIIDVPYKVHHNPGCYHLAGAYGGWELVQMGKNGGVTDIFRSGYIPKKELHGLILAFIEGIIRTRSNEL